MPLPINGCVVGYNVVENDFGIKKKNFKGLLLKTNLHVCFSIRIVMVCCYILYNMILDCKEIDVNNLKLQHYEKRGVL